MNEYVLEDFDSSSFTNSIILKHSATAIQADAKGFLDLAPERITVNEGIFALPSPAGNGYLPVKVALQTQRLMLSCGCNSPAQKLCAHQAQVLYNIVNREELRIFFDEKLRHQHLRKFAADYGLENAPDPDHYFDIAYSNRQLLMQPRMPALLPVTKASLQAMEASLFSAPRPPFRDLSGLADQTILCVVLRQHKYYKHLYIELCRAATTKEGKMKNPLTPVNPLDLVWGSEQHQEVKFFTAITRFQQSYSMERSAADIAGLKAIVANPRGLPFFLHNSEASEHITAASVTPVTLRMLPASISVTVVRNGDFFELGGQLSIDNQAYPLQELPVRYNYFLQAGNTLYLPEDSGVPDLVTFFKKYPGNVTIHHSRFSEFRRNILARLEDRVQVYHAYLEPATAAQLRQHGFEGPGERIIYLSDLGGFVMINPVIKYGEVEVPVLSKRQVYGVDDKGREFLVRRNDAAEIALTALLSRQHPYFREQLEEGQLYFYLPKARFLENDWFLQAIDEWHEQHITVLGFNELRGKKLHPSKAHITIAVNSGTNWFNTVITARFGKKKASLKQLQQAVKDKSRYVQLDDGTLGILPAQWLEKFAAWFQAGEVVEDALHTPRINFAAIDQLYDEDMLAPEVRQELALYKERFSSFDSIRPVPVPPELQATLRPYQQQGLNWLNFLDDFSFGGCLADDMGLGKSLQVIAFILSQRSKVQHNTNLLVAPTSLLFNWQEEVKKFAPSIKVLTFYGADRARDTKAFDGYEIVLTSYGTLLSDTALLRRYTFNYIFLDESQHIKNTASQRYRAARQLRARNRIAITGTPLENNTFDLYGQLSFACPGLLGGKLYFRHTYAIPIDQFKDRRRAAELQQRIHPFILRRTKQQVEKELPDKTEMVIYCEMPEEQRKVYDAAEKELREYIATRTEEDLPKSSMYVLKGLTRLRQLCNSPLLLKEGPAPEYPAAKIAVLTEQIESKAQQHKILVFSQFVRMLDLIGQALQARNIPYACLTGSTRNRGQAVSQFRNDHDLRVFLISLKAGGTGLNLTEADYVYIVDPWWNPAVENQAIDRCYRIGQHKNVMAIRLICPDTVEEKIMQLQASKKALAEGLVRTDMPVLKSLSRSDLMGLLDHHL